MAQPFEQSLKSLWGIEEVLEKQRKDSGFVQEDEEDDDMEAEYGEIDEETLMRELEG